MEILLNRWRGTGVIFTPVPLLTGSKLYALYLGLLIGFIQFLCITFSILIYKGF